MNYLALFRRLLRLTGPTDSPAWTLQAWDDDAETWRNVSQGATGSLGPIGPQGIQGPPGTRASGGALALSVGQNVLLDWGYLATMGGLAVLTASGEPIATAWPTVTAQPELVLTQAGAIIRC